VSLTTSADSPQTLPIKGYTVDQLKAYIRRQLGQPVFAVEITDQQILDIIADALQLYSIWRPKIRYGTLALNASQHLYLCGTNSNLDLDTGPFSVSFVYRSPLPMDLY
jgi:hypothetical protein